MSYFDSPDKLDSSGSLKTIPESGVYTEDLQSGHQGVMVQVIPNRMATVTVVLLDGDKELQRATVTGDKETAMVRAGKVSPVGPFRKP